MSFEALKQLFYIGCIALGNPSNGNAVAKCLHMNYECTNDTHNYTNWLITLVTIICECADMQPGEIAITEDEVRRYYHEGKSPYHVYHNIWQEDAGNFWAI